MTQQEYLWICKLLNENKTLLQTSVYGSQIVITNGQLEQIKKELKELVKDC